MTDTVPASLTGTKPAYSRWHIVGAWVLTGIALLLILVLHRLPSLLAGLLVYQLVHLLAPRLRISRLSDTRAKLIAIALLATLIVILLTVLSAGSLALMRSEGFSAAAMMQKMAEILEGSRHTMPAWIQDHLPSDAEAIKEHMIKWLREHAGELQTWGKNAGRAVAHVLIGMVIGAMISLREASDAADDGPLARALAERARRVSEAFRRVVFAQIRIAALNAFFTWLYLDVTLRLLGIKLPFATTMVGVTFLCGLLPVIGNLISNTIIFIISLSHSLHLAMASLMFLIVIHKLEYFLNARIVGGQIRAKAWELLLAMLSMEAAFGIAGVIAAPIYYAYLKDELVSQGQV